VRALGPGSHRLWKQHEVIRWDTDVPTFTAPAAVLKALPPDWYETVHLGPGQYGIVLRDDRPIGFLRPGVHRLWKGEGNIALRVFAETDPLPELTEELRKVIPASELLEAHVDLHQRAVLLRDGKPERVLAPAHHAFWGKHNKLAIWNIDELVLLAQPDVL